MGQIWILQKEPQQMRNVQSEKGEEVMKHMKKIMLLLLCILVIQMPAAVSAAPKKGWDSSKTHYYKNYKAVTGLQKISKKYYYFNSKGKVTKNKWKNLTVKGKKYRFYFGKDGAAYTAKANSFYVTFKTYKINKKTYGFDSKSHAATGIWATASGKVYYFNSKGLYNSTKTNKLRKLAKVGLKSAALLSDIQKTYGQPKKTRIDDDSCNYFDNDPGATYTDYVLLYDNIEIQLTRNNHTGIFCMNGVSPKEK